MSDKTVPWVQGGAGGAPQDPAPGAQTQPTASPVSASVTVDVSTETSPQTGQAEPLGESTLSDEAIPDAMHAAIAASGIDRALAEAPAITTMPTMADTDVDELAAGAKRNATSASPGALATSRDDPPTRHDADLGRNLALQEKIQRQLLEDSERKDDLIGQTVGGKFVIESRLGAGGMGAVYRARQADLGRAVAVKVLLDELTANDTQARRFTVEALAVSRLRHPNTIQILDFGKTDQGRLYIAMELLEGQTLHNAVATEGRMPVRRALHILAQVAAALDEAHGKGIVHRDLKPENIFLVRVGDDPDYVKVLDFGVAKLRDGVGDGQGTLTKAGSIFGTPRYMSPEQASARPVDARSDLYSLGIILFELVSGVPPFDSETPLTLLLAHVNQPVPRITARSPDAVVPREVELLIDALLEKKPAKRPDSAAVLRDRCLALAAALPADFDGLVDGETAAKLGIAVADAVTMVIEDAVAPSATPTLVGQTGAGGHSAGVTLGGLAAGDAKGEEARRRPVLLALVALSAVGALAALAFGVRRGDAPSAAAMTVAEIRQAPEPEAGPHAIAIGLVTTPSNAKVLALDEAGQTAGLLGETPTSLERPPGTVLRVRLLRDGHVPQDQTLTFDRTRELVLALTPTPPPSPKAEAGLAGADAGSTPTAGAAEGTRPGPRKPMTRPGGGDAPSAHPSATPAADGAKPKPKPKPDDGLVDDLM